MPEFREYIEYREFQEIDPDTLQSSTIYPEENRWDGWGDEEDRQRFYHQHGLLAPEVEPNSTPIAQITKADEWDGWGEPPDL